MTSRSTKLIAHGISTQYGQPVPEVLIEFGEQGYRVIRDTRPDGKGFAGYLHCDPEISAESITPAVRDTMISYYFNHPANLPGLGATPQRQYMQGLTMADREQIGNQGKRGYYNR